MSFYALIASTFSSCPSDGAIPTESRALDVSAATPARASIGVSMASRKRIEPRTKIVMDTFMNMHRTIHRSRERFIRGWPSIVSLLSACLADAFCLVKTCITGTGFVVTTGRRTLNFGELVSLRVNAQLIF